MTREEREEAIKRVSIWLDKGKQHSDYQLGYIEGWFTKEDEQAFQMAINALQMEPCDDYISRQRALDIVEFNRNSYDGNDAVVWIEREIKELPSVQPEQEIGQWLGTDEWYHKCSCCGEVFHFYYPEYTKLNKWNFCPRCGAKMESEDKE